MTKTATVSCKQFPERFPEYGVAGLGKRLECRILMHVNNPAIRYTQIQRLLRRAWRRLHTTQRASLEEHWSKRSPLLLIAPMMAVYPVAVHHDAYTLYLCSQWNGLSNEGTLAPCLLWMLYSAAAHADGSFFPTEHSVMNNLYPFIQYVYDFDTNCKLREQLEETAAIRKRAFVDKRSLL